MPKTLSRSKYDVREKKKEATIGKLRDEIDDLKGKLAVKPDPNVDVKDNSEDSKEKIYFSKSARHTLSGLVSEVRFPDGRMRGEQVVQFTNHFVITSDPKVQAHIEKSEPFAANFIKIVSRTKYGVLTEQLVRAKRTGEVVKA